jgi:alkanesulfonate monooxygenase
MELRIFTEPQQGATYVQLLAMARLAEELCYGAFFRSDHYLRIGPGDPGPGSTDAWVTLAGLARETETIRLGTLLTSATFRLPGPLAIAVAQVDAMSGGRIELGLGAGWYDGEHRAFGIPFPSTGERFEKLAEQLEILTGLWSAAPGESFSFSGTHYELEDSTALPKPAQRPHPPVIVGGTGEKKTPHLAARYANEFNVPFASAERCKALYGRVAESCDELGRDPSSIVRSVALTLCCGEDEATLERRAAAIGQGLDGLRKRGAAGTPDEVVAKLKSYGEAGATRVYLQVFDLEDFDQVRLVADQVMPAVAGGELR